MLDQYICEWGRQISPVVVPGDVFQSQMLHYILPFLVDVATRDTDECFVVTFGCPYIGYETNLRPRILKQAVSIKVGWE